MTDTEYKEFIKQYIHLNMKKLELLIEKYQIEKQMEELRNKYIT